MAASLSAAPPRPLWRRAASLAPFLAGGLLLLLMFGVPGFIVNTSHSEIGAEAAFGTADGREVLVIGYEDTGFSGLWMLAGETSGERVAAVDVQTGEVVWDSGLSDASWIPEVIAAGDAYAYVRSANGLAIVSMENGETVVEGEDIVGLGEGHLDDEDAYLYDPERHSVIAVTAGGAVKEIPVDEVSAAEAGPAVRDTWSCLFPEVTGRPGGRIASFEQTLPSAIVGGSADGPAGGGDAEGSGTSLSFHAPGGAPRGVPARHLYIAQAGETDSREITGTEFYTPGFVQEVTWNRPYTGACPDAEWPFDGVLPGESETSMTTAGTATGHVIVEGAAGPNTEEKVLTVVDAETGEAASATPVHRFDRAMTAPSGRTVLTTSSFFPPLFDLPVLPRPLAASVLIIDEEGKTHRAVIGRTNYFGV
ncbi:PA2928 family protein [Nocardiopsis composta]|uniref:Uncharacterized protein n=1 Tax=Nocardiopsis composta TaxID=157465 RepID=A0A7W8QLP8_9ACTN|nr:PA2928 family protein [Nocardiopsis composta]MBB5432767.1 hypothetical protein [Nocardiopsis composta]